MAYTTTAKEFIEGGQLQDMLGHPATRELQALIKLAISGDDGGTWYYDVAARTHSKRPSATPSCILEAQDIRSALTVVVLSANDPVAAWGGVKLLRERFGIEPCVVTGPATDNAVGVDIIREQMGVAAFNAMTSGAELGDHVITAAGLGTVARETTVPA